MGKPRTGRAGVGEGVMGDRLLLHCGVAAQCNMGL